MTRTEAEEFKNKSWFVKITCPQPGNYVVHAESWLVPDCVHPFENYRELLNWSRGWDY